MGAAVKSSLAIDGCSCKVCIGYRWVQLTSLHWQSAVQTSSALSLSLSLSAVKPNHKSRNMQSGDDDSLFEVHESEKEKEHTTSFVEEKKREKKKDLK